MSVDKKEIRQERKDFINANSVRRKKYKENKYFFVAKEISKGIKVVIDAIEEECSERIKEFSCKKKVQLTKPLVTIKKDGGLTSILTPLSYEKMIESEYEIDDTIHDGNGQTKRSLNGGHWEYVTQKLFDLYAPGKYIPQYRIHSPISNSYKKVDFVLTNEAGQRAYISLKCSLRERHRLASDEKSFVDKHIGDAPVYLLSANRYKKFSKGALDDLRENDVILVTDKKMVDEHYSSREGVISFEDFFLTVVPTFIQSQCH